MKRIVALLLPMIATVLLCAATLAPPSSALTSTGDGAWFWRSPQPQGSWLHAVCRVGDRLVAVGDGGTILSSDDAGATWQAHSSGTWLSLSGVTFVDAANGWAVGGETDYSGEATIRRSVILHTSDGGLTWNTQVIPVKIPLAAVAFSDDDSGWAVGDRGTVLHTTDGGQTWIAQASGTSESLACVTFVDSAHGWIGGPVGVVLRTADGGLHWRRVTLGTWARERALVKPAFADTAHGVAVLADPYGPSDGGSEPALAQTSDGGATWQPLATPKHLGFTSLTFDGSGGLWVAAVDQVSNATLFLYSGDGGHSWSRRYVDVMAPQDMVGTGAGLCAVGAGVLTHGPDGPWLARGSIHFWTPTLLQMFDDQDGVGVQPQWLSPSNHPLFLRTTDGVNWDVVGRLPKEHTEAVVFADAQHGWVVGTAFTQTWPGERGLLLRTSDGGLTWQPQSTSLRGVSLVGASYVDAQHGWVCGDDMFASSEDTLYVTSDGGATLRPQKLPAGFGAQAVDFISAQEGWVVGETAHGQVSAHTVDGGAHWTLSTTRMPDLALTSVSFIDARHGWATGYDFGKTPSPSVVVATTDSGATWTRQGVGTSLQHYALTGAAFISPQRGWLFAGDQQDFFAGGVWQTSDGGITWAPEQAGVGPSGISGFSVLGNTVYAAGPAGFLSTTDRSGDSAPPASYDDFDGHYHRSDVTIHLAAADIGGGTVATTEYRLGDDSSWQTYNGAIVLPAPADHSNDGLHRLYYRSLDSYGNVEPSGWWLTVPIDTLGPTTLAGPPAIVVRGSTVHLAYRIDEKTSPRAHVVIHILSASGRSIETLVRNSPVNHLERLSGRCGLRPGRYRYVVYARDLAGNPQVHAGWGRLIVKRI